MIKEGKIVDAKTLEEVEVSQAGEVAKHKAFTAKDGFKAAFFCKNLDESQTVEPKFDLGYMLGDAVITVGVPVLAYAARCKFAPQYKGVKSWSKKEELYG